MLRWFRPGLPPHQAALAMIGVRAGDAVLFTDAGEPALAAEVALVTGLNGRTVVVDRAGEARARVERAAAEAGALLEFEEGPADRLPFDRDTFDVVVVTLAADRSQPTAGRAVIAEAFRLLRPGGRAIVRTPAARAGIFGAAGSGTGGTGRPPPPQSPLDLLQRAGAVAARKLADVKGVSFYEARKPRDEST